MRLPTTASAMASLAVSKLQQRLSIKDTHEYHDLMQRFIETKTLDTQGTIGLLMSTISGGGDTTATTITAVVYYLIKHPTAMEILRKELQQANLDRPIPTYNQTKDLPYLAAVIKETMRIFPILTYPMERRVPTGGAVISGQFFPEGTSVGCFTLAVHYDRSVFGDDVAEFRPERWLDCDKETLKKMESSSLGFSRGKRVCLGQNIALLQLKKVIAALVMEFKVYYVLLLRLYFRADNFI
jgi:cytochrome P450